jgi:hypothetical protein
VAPGSYLISGPGLFADFSQETATGTWLLQMLERIERGGSASTSRQTVERFCTPGDERGDRLADVFPSLEKAAVISRLA